MTGILAFYFGSVALHFPHLAFSNMFDKWFGAAIPKQFGAQMGMLLVQTAAREAGNVSRKKSAKNEEKRFDTTLYSIEKQLAKFTASHRLNIYSKAQLGSAFKFTLLENGFEPEVANTMTTWLLLRCK